MTEPLGPIRLPLGTQSFGGSLIDDFEAVGSAIFGDETADCELENRGFAAASRRGEDEIVGGVEDCFEAFGLDGVENVVRKDAAETIWEACCGDEFDALNNWVAGGGANC